jgi:hypothetical protein
MMKMLQVRDRFIGHFTTQLAHMHGKALRVARILRQPVQSFYVHALTLRTIDPPLLKFQMHTVTGHGEIANTPSRFVIAPLIASAAPRTDGSFFRRRSVTTRAYLSPKTPRNLALAVNPGKQNSSFIVLGDFMFFLTRKQNTFLSEQTNDFSLIL